MAFSEGFGSSKLASHRLRRAAGLIGGPPEITSKTEHRSNRRRVSSSHI